MPCKKCSDLREKIGKNVSLALGTYPSILELAYMVNLQYYYNMEHSCIHDVPEDPKADISVKEMVDFLDNHKWEWGTQTRYNGFNTTTLKNRVAHQVVIVHRGTENWEQMKADILLALDVTSQDTVRLADWHTTNAILNNAIKEENGKFVRNDYTVTITGHSLGGWLAQLCTLICKFPKFHPVGPRGQFMFANGKSIDMNQPHDLHCVAFDSPGASTILKRLDFTAKATSWLVGRDYEVKDAMKKLDINVFLSNRNAINFCGDHVGKVERLDVMKYYSWYQKLNPIGSHYMGRILNFFIKENW